MESGEKASPIIAHKNSLAYPVSAGDAPIRLVDKAAEIEKATASVKLGVHQKLDVILKEIRHLQEMAKEIMEKAEEDIALHHIPCNFPKKPGDTIYLYRRKKNGTNPPTDVYFSRLSPEDWNGEPIDEYMDAYRVQPDLSYEKLENG